MICENCKISYKEEHRFCSVACARSFSTSRNREERNNKISISLRKEKIVKFCQNCNKEFFGKKRQKFCSRSCGALFISRSQVGREQRRKQAINASKSPNFKGWISRKKSKQSYPEIFWTKVLEQNNLSFEREFKIGKYFIDFAFHEQKIALEIDGKQHLQEERKNSDLKKDSFLVSLGWKVYRIPWNGTRNIKEQIKRFLEFIRV